MTSTNNTDFLTAQQRSNDELDAMRGLLKLSKDVHGNHLSTTSHTAGATLIKHESIDLTLAAQLLMDSSLDIFRFTVPGEASFKRDFSFVSLSDWLLQITTYKNRPFEPKRKCNVPKYLEHVHCFTFQGTLYITIPSILRIVRLYAFAQGRFLNGTAMRNVLYSALRTLNGKGKLSLEAKDILLKCLHEHGCLDMDRSQAIYPVAMVDFQLLAKKVLGHEDTSTLIVSHC